MNSSYNLIMVKDNIFSNFNYLDIITFFSLPQLSSPKEKRFLDLVSGSDNNSISILKSNSFIFFVVHKELFNYTFLSLIHI